MITRRRFLSGHAKPRVAAAWTIAGGAWVATALFGLDAADRSSGFYAAEMVWIAIHALVLLGLVGLWHSDVGGGGRWGRRGLALAIAGRCWFIVSEFAAIALGHDELPIFPIAVVSTGLGMLVAGVAAVRAGRWSGWRAASVLAMGAYPLSIIVPTFAVTGHRPANVVVAAWGLTFLWIGGALHRTSDPQSTATLPPVAAASGTR